MSPSEVNNDPTRRSLIQERTDSTIVHRTMPRTGIKQKNNHLQSDVLTEERVQISSVTERQLVRVKLICRLIFLLNLFFPLADKALICEMNEVCEMMVAC